MKHYVTWKQVEDFIDSVVENYKDKNITGVYGLPRGGLVFAVMLSNRLDIPLLLSPIEGCMIVDDICDSGESLVHYRNNTSGNKINNYSIVTMYYHNNDIVTVDYYKYKKENDWIVFPWEEKEPITGIMG